MAKVLILTDQFVTPENRMAGLQIRTFEMARALSRSGHSVTIAAVNHAPKVSNWNDLSLVGIDAVGRSVIPEVWIGHPLLIDSVYKRLKEVPLVVDGYEFPFASFYANAADHQRQFGDKAIYAYHSTIVRYISALSLADRVVCATDAQRIGYLSLLAAIGRINPKYDNEDILLTVCSGTPPEAPYEQHSSAQENEDLTVLWAGGCYPWFDIETYVHALDRVVESVPKARFVFAGLAGVNGRTSDKDVYAGVMWLKEHLSRTPHVKGKSSFVEWLPYNDRGELYRKATIGVCTHRSSVESTFAMRTRVIDMIWGGLPVVCTGTDAMSTYVEAHNIGERVNSGDSESLAKAISGLLLNRSQRHERSQRARTIAEHELSWDTQVLPLHKFCANPACDPSRSDRVISGTLAKTFDRSVVLRSGIQNNLMRLVWALQRHWRENRI